MASLDESMKRLEGALGQLEAAIGRRLDLERRRGDLETELQLMQDDRTRLAVELDGTTARLNRFETAAADLDARVSRAMRAVGEVLGASPQPARET